MKLHTKFGFWLGGFFLLFWVIASVLFYSYFRAQIEQQAFATSRQIVHQVDAIQSYVREQLRPVMSELVGADEFIPEAMSTTFVARNTTERFQKQYPDYYFKLATTNPRNPVNLADQVEQKIIEQFESDQALTEWKGIIDRDGQPYLSVATPLRFDISCMSCHGDPADAPASLLTRYGAVAGFYRHSGEVAIKSVGVPVAGALASARNRALAFAGLAGVFLIGLSGISFYLFRALVTRPIEALQRGATQIGEGNLSYRVTVERSDEMSMLASLFNSMATRMSSLVGTLEQRVTERTHELEHRSTQLQAVIEVSNAITSIRDPGELLTRVTHLISERFGFYHVGIFLLDANSEYAVLRATNSEGGRRMLARQHKLRVGQSGIVGYATGRKQPRIAMDVGQDAVFFNNPDLPDTRSEMALPLLIGNQLLGALDIQSTEEAAFTKEDVVVLQSLADQVAVAIENARLFAASEQAIEAERSAYGQISGQAWQQILGARFDLGYVCDARGHIRPVTEGWEHTMIKASQTGRIVRDASATVAVPIKIRDQVLGVVRLCKRDDTGSWTSEEIELLETLVEQLSVALESAQLHQDTQNRAERERLIGEITARMRETLDIETVLKTTAQQVRQALGLPEVTIRLGTTESPAPGNGDRGDGEARAGSDGHGERTV